ncbi:unnamed protein product [Diamesa tonsa]
MAKELKAKKVLQLALENTYVSFTADQLFSVFRNLKYSHAQYSLLIKQLFKNNVADFDRLFQIYESSVLRKSEYEAFVTFLINVNYTNGKPAEFESPALCSTRIIDNNVLSSIDVVSEIKEKLAQATQQSQQNTRISTNTFRQSLNASGSNLKKNSVSTTTSTKNSITTWNFSFNDDLILPIQSKMPKTIVGLPASAQEKTIISELLYTLVGVNGTLIVPKLKTIAYDTKEDFGVSNRIENGNPSHSIVEFELNEQIQESIRDLLLEILPLANYYYQIQGFIETSRAAESGQVLQALSAALRKLINDYYTSITHLESLHLKHDLNLHKLLFFLRPIFQSMETIAQTVSMLQQNNIRGGNVLTWLHDSISLYSGDKKSQEILIYLIQMSAEPYMEILKLWILKGVICDPKQEFLIEDNESECNPEQNENYYDDYWEKRYVIRSEKIPRFLEKQADIILRTGKYLNVVRECSKLVPLNQTQSANLKFSHTDDHYISIINDAYAFSSKSLLELIMDDNDLMGRLISVKRYFLLQQGDFIVQFMDACEKELSKNVDEVIPMRLENLLELTLRLSSAKHDKYQDDLFTTLMPFGIATQMSKIIKSKYEDEIEDVDTSELTGIECFTFGYNVQWPVSIVLNQMTISKYQLIFRQLYYCKHVERILCRVWTANNNAKKFDHKTAELYRSAFTLRQRMMNMVQNLEYYMMVEVIEPVWHIFLQQFSKAKNIDDVLIYHEDFLDHCLKNCMLTYPDLLKNIIQLCNICIEFCTFIEDAQKHFIDAELSSMLSKTYMEDDNSGQYDQSESSMAPSETFSQRVTRFDTEFTDKLIGFLNKIHYIAEKNQSEKFINLIHRINFNSFYTAKLVSIRS